MTARFAAPQHNGGVAVKRPLHARVAAASADSSARPGKGLADCRPAVAKDLVEKQVRLLVTELARTRGADIGDRAAGRADEGFAQAGLCLVVRSRGAGGHAQEARAVDVGQQIGHGPVHTGARLGPAMSREPDVVVSAIQCIEPVAVRDAIVAALPAVPCGEGSEQLAQGKSPASTAECHCGRPPAGWSPTPRPGHSLCSQPGESIRSSCTYCCSRGAFDPSIRRREPTRSGPPYRCRRLPALRCARECGRSRSRARNRFRQPLHHRARWHSGPRCRRHRHSTSRKGAYRPRSASLRRFGGARWSHRRPDMPRRCRGAG